jgi:hypothetical protein
VIVESLMRGACPTHQRLPCSGPSRLGLRVMCMSLPCFGGAWRMHVSGRSHWARQGCLLWCSSASPQTPRGLGCVVTMWFAVRGE